MNVSSLVPNTPQVTKQYVKPSQPPVQFGKKDKFDSFADAFVHMYLNPGVYLGIAKPLESSIAALEDLDSHSLVFLA